MMDADQLVGSPAFVSLVNPVAMVLLTMKTMPTRLNRPSLLADFNRGDGGKNGEGRFHGPLD